MAGHSENQHGDSQHGAMDISAHRSSYDGFMSWAKIGTVVCFVIVAIVVLIIA